MEILKRLAPQLIALAALVAVVTAFYPAFLNIAMNDGRLVGPVIDVLKRSAPVALLAVGMTLVIATRGIDLSVGTIMAICGAVAAAAVAAGWGLPAALVLALGAGALAGLWNGVLVAIVGIQPFVATLILMTMGRGVAQALAQTNHRVILVDVVESALEQEIAVTHSINRVVDACRRAFDFGTEEFMKWFVKEQIEEEYIARRAVELFDVIGEEGVGRYMIDKAIPKISYDEDGE